MASEKTPNLGLNQIDRTSPKTTYFDLEKYLDQNWRAVDDFAGDVNDGVNAIKKRLDTMERKAVTLEPGVQIVHAEKAAPFSLAGLSGRTLVNLAGRDWGVSKTLSRFGRFQSTLDIEMKKSIVGGGSLKITAELANAIADGFGNTTTTIKAGKKYIALGNLYNESGSNMQIVIQKTSFSTPLVTSKNKWEFTYVAFSPSVDVNNIQAMARLNVTAAGQVGYADALRLYEISDAEYTALTNMTAEQIASKYPYVDSITPVRNPYAIRSGENLLPSFYEWSVKQGNPVILDLKSVLVTSDNKLIHNVSPVVPGKTYTLSVESSDVNGRISITNSVESTMLADKTGFGLLSVTFTVPAGETNINVRLLGAATTVVTISNPMLNIGSTAQPFKPRVDSMLALQTDLYADPVTGANADTVFEREGQYFKYKNWHRVVLDGSFTWELPGSYAGYKVVGISGLPAAAAWNALYVTKYDGKILSKNSGMTSADNAYFRNQATKDAFDISISSADSGWGDNYTPTADDIKAYFNGWKMKISGQAASSTYDGTGTKAWVEQAYARNTPSYVGEVKDLNRISSEGPLAYTLNGLTPYQLVYQLATSTVEPIVSEGQLTFNEGDNQVEVGTGIVLRESADVYTETVTSYGNRMNINNASFSARLLKNRTTQMLSVYKNGALDMRWSKSNGWVTNAGALAQLLYASDEDRESAYSVTYLMLDRSPVVPFTGTYAVNEKTILVDLVESVQQANSRVSVLENKKADKDNPSWLMPTLLNGWAGEVQYLRLSEGLVLFRGGIRDGATPPGTHLFTLSAGYRPKKDMEIRVRTSDGSNDALNSTIIIKASGVVVTQNAWFNRGAWFDGISFLAEQ